MDPELVIHWQTFWFSESLFLHHHHLHGSVPSSLHRAIDAQKHPQRSDAVKHLQREKVWRRRRLGFWEGLSFRTVQTVGLVSVSSGFMFPWKLTRFHRRNSVKCESMIFMIKHVIVPLWELRSLLFFLSSFSDFSLSRLKMKAVNQTWTSGNRSWFGRSSVRRNVWEREALRAMEVKPTESLKPGCVCRLKKDPPVKSVKIHSVKQQIQKSKNQESERSFESFRKGGRRRAAEEESSGEFRCPGHCQILWFWCMRFNVFTSWTRKDGTWNRNKTSEG